LSRGLLAGGDASVAKPEMENGMDLASVMAATADLTEVKAAMIRSMHLLAEMAHDNAKLALRSADSLLSLVEEGAPCSAGYTNYSRVQTSLDRAQQALASSADVANLILALNDTPDREAKYAYGVHLTEMIDSGVVVALCSAAQERLNLFHKLMPDNPAPAARFYIPEQRPPEQRSPQTDEA
jgi:hypothetical protein